MRILLTSLAIAAGALLTPAAPAQQRPDPAAQKAAMQKLKFLAGTWTGEAVVSHPSGQIAVQQTETVQYRLDGLLMVIEGIGRNPEGKPVFQAFAVISVDPSGLYRIRAWNEGRFVETEMKVGENGFEWGFQPGPVTILNRMEIDQQGRWNETSEATLADGRKVHSVRMTLKRTQH
jgi:hypothetical protein